MSYSVDSYGNAYFPMGVFVKDIRLSDEPVTQVIIPGPNGRLMQAPISAIISETPITSVFGRTGVIVGEAGDYNTSLVTEGSNLYFTEARARNAISLTNVGTNTAASYNPTTGVLNIPTYSFTPLSRTITINGVTHDLSANRSWTITPDVAVTSFNARYGDVVLTSTDVIDALGFTPMSGYAETDPTVPGHVKLITTTNISNWNYAYSWGNHNVAGYLSASLAASTYTPLSRTITINGVTYDLTVNRSWSIAPMVYPAAGIAVSTGSAWAASITDNSSNWNTAYGWGNHASEGYELASNKGIPGGYASLDGGGRVPAGQLPSYVDDVLEYADLGSFPGTGESGKIYVTIDTNKTYRWTGSIYVEISASPGTTDAVPEGLTNLYFTTARARNSISVSGSLSYNPTTGVISYTQPSNVSAFVNDAGYITAAYGYYIGTTLNALNRASGAQTLSGIRLSGIDNTYENALLQSGAGRTDDANGDTWIFADSLGSSSFKWGVKHNQLSNLIEFWGANTANSHINLVTGDYSGNAATVTNGVYVTGSYSNPSWITSLAWGKITGAPAFLTSESDTLNTVVLRGSVTNTSVSLLGLGNLFSGHHYFAPWDADGNHYPHYNSGANNNGSKLNLRMFDASGNVTLFHLNGVSKAITWDGNTIWHSGNLTNLSQLSNGPGYITGYTETDTLQSVTARGASTSIFSYFNGGIYAPVAYLGGNINFDAVNGRAITWGLNTDAAFIKFVSTGNGAGLSYLEIGTTDDLDEQIIFSQSGNIRVKIHTDGHLKNGSNQFYVYENSATWAISVSGTAGSIYGYNNPTTAATPNTIAYRDAAGDITVRELVLNVAVQDFTPSSLVAIYPTTNQAVKVTASGAREFLDVPTRTGGSASGTWAINVTGNSGTSGILNVDNAVVYGRHGLQFAQWYEPIGNNPAIHQVPPGGGWWHTLRMNHGNGAGYYADLAVSMTTNLGLSRRVISNGVQLSDWVTILDALNYTAYALSINGGSLSSGSDQILTINKTSGSFWNYIGFSHLGTRKGYFGLDSSGNPVIGSDTGVIQMLGTVYANNGISVTGDVTSTTSFIVSRNVGTNDYPTTGQHQMQLRIRKASLDGGCAPRTLELGVLDDGVAVIQANHCGVGYNTLALNPVSGSVTVNGHTVLHANNYTSYALPANSDLFGWNVDNTDARVRFNRSSVDDYLIGYSSGRGYFGIGGYGWHMSSASSFHIMSSGWVSRFGIRGSDGYTRIGASVEVNGDIYLGTRGVWLSGWLNQSIRTDAAPSFSGLTISGGRPFVFNSSGGALTVQASTGGWSMGTYYLGSSGTYLAGFGAYGGDNSLVYAWIGPGYDSSWVRLTPTTSTFLNQVITSSTANGGDHGIRVGAVRGSSFGSQTGDYIMLYERVHIGYPSGWGAAAASAPSYGLGVWGNIHVSQSGVTGGGIILADDGDIVDMNDAWCSMRFTAGVRIYSGNRSGSPVIGLGSDGVISASNVTVSGNSVLHTGNWSTYAAPRAYVGDSYVDFTIYGDQNTYYPVIIQNWNGGYGFQRYSISRFYADTAPWNPIGTGTHQGGLTFTFEWAGDIAWGGNDKSIRIIEFGETYTTMVGGLQLAHCEGVVVWLRGGGGGGAVYRLHGPGGRSQVYTIQMSTWASCSGTTYSPRSYDGGLVNSEINSRYPVRGSGSGDMYVNNAIVLNASNYNSYSPTLTGVGASGTWNINISGNANNITQYTINQNLGTGNSPTFSSLYTTIIYDSNDNSYYLDPNSTSRLYRVNGYYLSYQGDVSENHPYGVYFSNNLSTSYAIYREAGAWNWPYPDLRIAFHTGIKIGANAGYGGVRFYSDFDMATVVASINDGDMNLRGYYDIIAYASDRRLKEDIKPIEDAVSKVMKLTGMTYKWNSVGEQYGWKPSEEREAGVFAQDVQEVLPEAVRLAPFDEGHDEHGNKFSKSGQNFLTVKYDKLVPLLLEAIKEQQKQIDELKKLIQ